MCLIIIIIGFKIIIPALCMIIIKNFFLHCHIHIAPQMRRNERYVNKGLLSDREVIEKNLIQIGTYKFMHIRQLHRILSMNVIAERLSARFMIVHSALAMGKYIYMSVTLLRLRRHVRIATVRSMGMNSCVCV